MIPRADIDAVSIDTKVDDLVSFINKTKHSRIPVFQDNLDKIIETAWNWHKRLSM